MPSKGNRKGRDGQKGKSSSAKGLTHRKAGIECLREHLDHVCQSILEAIKETRPSAVLWSINRKQKSNTEAQHYYDQEWELVQGTQRVLKLSVSTHNPPRGAVAYLYVTGNEDAMQMWDDLYYDVVRPIVMLCGGKNKELNIQMLIESLPTESAFRQELIPRYNAL